MTDDEGPNIYYVGAEGFYDVTDMFWRPWSDGHGRVGWRGTSPDGTRTRIISVHIDPDGTPRLDEEVPL